MIKNYVLSYIISAAICGIFAAVFIPLLRRLKYGQPILSYLSEHYEKSGTPTMGGLFFVAATIFTFLIFSDGNRTIALVSLAVTACYMVIGFFDDYIKIRFCRNEGLTPIQKIIFQIAVAVVASLYAYTQGLTKINIPFTTSIIDIGALIIPLAILVFLATTNCVNLTDGLDGLAANTTKLSLFAFVALIFLQLKVNNKNYVNVAEYQNLALFAICLGGALSGFLLFNTFRASVFMGDTGSLSLGGAFASIMIFSGNALFIPIIGITFVLSGISVIIQVIYFKRTKKRIFLMAPFHHHLQHKGLSESKIVYIYGVITVVCTLLSLLCYC